MLLGSAVSVLIVGIIIYWQYAQFRCIRRVVNRGALVEEWTIEPDWIIKYIGYFNAFNRVHTVSVSPDRYDRELLIEIANLSGLTRLRLENCPVTDDDLKLLSGLDNLKELALSSTKIKGKTLDQLSCKQSLRIIALMEMRTKYWISMSTECVSHSGISAGPKHSQYQPAILTQPYRRVLILSARPDLLARRHIARMASRRAWPAPPGGVCRTVRHVALGAIRQIGRNDRCTIDPGIGTPLRKRTHELGLNQAKLGRWC